MVFNKTTIAPEINFLAKQRARLLIEARRIYLIQVVSISVLAAYGFILFSIFSYSALLGYQYSQVQNKITTAKSDIDALKNIEGKYYTVKQKTQTAIGIYQTIQQHQLLIETIFKILPEGLTVEGISIDENGFISFTASSDDPKIVDQFIKNIESGQNSDPVRVSNASIEGVSVSDKGTYSVNTKLKLLAKQ